MDFLGFDISNYLPIIGVVGVIFVVLGIYLKGSAKKSAACAFFSFLFFTIGAVCILLIVSNWIGSAVGSWQNYAEVF